MARSWILFICHYFIDNLSTPSDCKSDQTKFCPTWHDNSEDRSHCLLFVKYLANTKSECSSLTTTFLITKFAVLFHDDWLNEGLIISCNGLTAFWQTLSMALLRSPRPILIRQCSVRPLRCRPEHWASISVRQWSTISGLREKSSISIRR